MADKKDPKDAKDEEDKDKEKEGEEGGEGKPAEGKKGLMAKLKARKKLVIILLVLVLAGTGGGLYFAGIIPGKSEAETTGKKGKKKKKEEGGEHGTTGSSAKAVKQNLNDWVPGIVPGHENDDVAYYNLPEFLVNLNTGGKQSSFIKMKITLEAPGDSDLESVESYMPRITDSFNTYMRELRSSDLAGSAGLYRLREELLLRVNKIVYPSKVNDILFRELIIQ